MGLSVYQRIKRAFNDGQPLLLTIEDVKYLANESWFETELKTAFMKMNQLQSIVEQPAEEGLPWMNRLRTNEERARKNQARREKRAQDKKAAETKARREQRKVLKAKAVKAPAKKKRNNERK